jgi:hypothetical protein
MKIVWLALWSLLPGSSGLAQALKKQHRLQLFSWDEVEDGAWEDPISSSPLRKKVKESPWRRATRKPSIS